MFSVPGSIKSNSECESYFGSSSSTSNESTCFLDLKLINLITYIPSRIGDVLISNIDASTIFQL